jgi:hypothetical protein
LGIKVKKSYKNLPCLPVDSVTTPLTRLVNPFKTPDQPEESGYSQTDNPQKQKPGTSL